MDARKRLENERKFKNWQTLPDGGRIYFYALSGHHGWTARYVKEVDADEETLRFYQEVYDQTGKLVEVHHKFPYDTGHQRITGG